MIREGVEKLRGFLPYFEKYDTETLDIDIPSGALCAGSFLGRLSTIRVQPSICDTPLGGWRVNLLDVSLGGESFETLFRRCLPACVRTVAVQLPGNERRHR
ncbi:hypothetical protein PFISCL1PPCAC_4708 [Pristionchus fissidentatus]|uniref:Uncharacterized protein n=1 Tax=Pristionchus fissidentatus TaxID=1538716 RepID=A0AAV5V1I5_9BILA|nr:hypothetical protein PFISCL1PPCAC_4708 [Pristionchus fissidentatus]